MLPLLLAAVAQTVLAGYTPQELWRVWPQERFVGTAAPCLREPELTEKLRELAARHAGKLRLEEIGRSFLNRPIHLLSLGHGPTKILLWSQMHGDEPSATPALLDLADFLLRRADQPAAAAILDRLELLMIPMLNPDGAQLYDRRNAQGIDINRDALNLATPEGRILKRVRDEHQPILGFNLHDQDRRTAVGDSGRLATNAVLAVAADPDGTLTPERHRAKRACAAIVEALAPFMPGGMARYDEDWSPRAFGDNLTAWGTAVVLLESGGLPPGHQLSELTRLNFVALLAVLQDLARDDLAGRDPAVYEALQRNESDAWADVAVRGGFVLQPGTAVPFRADLSFNRLRSDRLEAGCAVDEPWGSSIFELGDSRFIAAGRSVAADRALLLAPWVVGAEGWSVRRWLTAEVAIRLARLGVGTVRWRVGRRRLQAAETLARRLQGPRRPRIEVVTGPSPPARLNLRRPPPEPAAASLRAVLVALAGERWWRQAESRGALATLGDLWLAPGAAELAPPRLRPGQPASFLLVAPAEAGRLDVDRARLSAVWIDGAEVPWQP